jgi:hypothetical protein
VGLSSTSSRSLGVMRCLRRSCVRDLRERLRWEVNTASDGDNEMISAPADGMQQIVNPVGPWGPNQGNAFPFCNEVNGQEMVLGTQFDRVVRFGMILLPRVNE